MEKFAIQCMSFKQLVKFLCIFVTMYKILVDRHFVKSGETLTMIDSEANIPRFDNIALTLSMMFDAVLMLSLCM